MTIMQLFTATITNVSIDLPWKFNKAKLFQTEKLQIAITYKTNTVASSGFYQYPEYK